MPLSASRRVLHARDRPESAVFSGDSDHGIMTSCTRESEVLIEADLIRISVPFHRNTKRLPECMKAGCEVRKTQREHLTKESERGAPAAHRSKR